MEEIKSQTKLGEFKDFSEITDYFNQMIDDIWKLREIVRETQSNLKGGNLKNENKFNS